MAKNLPKGNTTFDVYMTKALYRRIKAAAHKDLPAEERVSYSRWAREVLRRAVDETLNKKEGENVD